MLQSEEAIPQMEADLIFDQTNLNEAENVTIGINGPPIHCGPI